MTGWSTPADLSAEARRWWQRGLIVRAVLQRATATSSEPPFPRRLALRRPASRDLSRRFAEVRDWVRAIDAVPHVRIEHRNVRHAELGENRLPDAVWLDDPQAAAALAGRARELRIFEAVAARALEHDARLLAWLQARPLRVLELADELDGLLAVHRRMRDEPAPGRYLRTIDVPGVHSKFIEAHRDTLGAWLDLTLDAAAIDARHVGTRGFARRYGYRDKPLRVRLRSLDGELALIEGSQGRDAGAPVAATPTDHSLATADLTLDIENAARLHPAHRLVLIVENEINYLSLPTLPSAIAVFGAGYGLDAIATLPWFADKRLLYWGDIDTHGFAILDELRSRRPRVRSLLMDRDTLLAHRAFIVEEARPQRRELTRLTDDEAALYDELRHDVHGSRVRLEQERIGFARVVSALKEASSPVGHTGA